MLNTLCDAVEDILPAIFVVAFKIHGGRSGFIAEIVGDIVLRRLWKQEADAAAETFFERLPAINTDSLVPRCPADRATKNFGQGAGEWRICYATHKCPLCTKSAGDAV